MPLPELSLDGWMQHNRAAGNEGRNTRAILLVNPDHHCFRPLVVADTPSGQTMLAGSESTGRVMIHTPATMCMMRYKSLCYILIQAKVHYLHGCRYVQVAACVESADLSASALQLSTTCCW